MSEFLNIDESNVYILTRFEQNSSEDIPGLTAKLKDRDSKYFNYTCEDVKRILASIDRKINMSASPSRFQALINKYWRILTVSKSHYQEESENIKHVFSMDYSDIRAYLNPSQEERENWDNIGSIYYMFNEKSAFSPELKEKYDYCMLPPASWEALHNIREEYVRMNTDYNVFRENPKIEDFYQFINSVNKNNLKTFTSELPLYYKELGGWIEVLMSALEGRLEDKLNHTLSSLDNMSRSKVIRPINDDEVNAEVATDTFISVLSELEYDRKGHDKQNKVDALNLALTYNLTDKNVEKQKDAIFYRIVSHSKWPSKAFREITYKGKYISCCPPFVSTLILNQKGIVNLSDDFLDKNIKRLEQIMQYDSEIPSIYSFAAEKFLNQHKTIEGFRTEVLAPIHRYLTDIIEFDGQLNGYLIEHIRKINAGDKNYGNYEGYYKGNPENIEKLRQIFDKQTYSTITAKASQIIYDNLEKTYKVLYKYVNENHNCLLPEMMDLLKTIDNRKAQNIKMSGVPRT